MTIHGRVAVGRQRLREAGIAPEEADLDARLLAQHVLGWTMERFVTDANGPEPPDFAPRYDVVVGRRAAREPLAYIVGHQEFWGLQFEVTPAVLIPRPETELIVETVLDLFPDSASFTMADVCTGSGCVAVSVARERPAATIVATDISGDAIEVARRNAQRHAVAERIAFSRADLLAGIDREVQAIVANPPYVAERDRRAMQPEVVDYEPGFAVFAGADGLDVITRLVADAPARLGPGGRLVFEFGFGQDAAVERLVEHTWMLKLTSLRRDLQAIPRVAVAERR